MLLFYFVYFLFLPTCAYAYLDPGTGSMLVYALIGIASSLIFAFKNVFFKFLTFLMRKKVNTTERSFDIVFHSEGSKYFHVFLPIISALREEKVKSVYITPDSEDIAFSEQDAYFEVINPGNELETINFMNFINATVVISTTPHLDIYMWRKSKNVGKYIKIFHSPTGIDFYEKYALSFYDIIFSVGPFTQIAQEYLDNKRNLPAKRYYPVGCTYYDYMLNEYKTANSNAKKHDVTILYAPTWGKNRSSFFTEGHGIVEKLLLADFNVIFRPHPQFYVSHKTELNNFIKQFNNFRKFVVNNDMTPVGCMVQSDILITDFSGVLFDYAYLTYKPVLLINVQKAYGGYEAEELIHDNKDFDIKASLTLAHLLSENELENISDTVKRVIADSRSIQNEIQKFKENNIYNFGEAGKVAAKYIQEIKSEMEGE